MATVCRSFARGKMLRLTRLDDCGVPVAGANSVVTSSGMVSVTATPVYQDQEEITVTNANGDLCIDDQSDPALRWLTLAVVLCNVDPYAWNIITGDPIDVDDAAPTPNTTGIRIDAATTGSAKFAMEVWSGVPGQACNAEGFPEYGYWLYPFVVQAQIGEYVVENAGLTMTFTARTSAGSGWDVGPYDVRREVLTPFDPAPLLTPIGPTQHGLFDVFTAPLPTAACGATALPPA